MALSVLVPVTLTDAMVVSSTIAETDYTAYNAATTYSLGQRCISTVTHRIYESAIASNLNNDPTLIENRSGTTIEWLDIGPTNKWAMFDSVNNTQSSATSPITVVITPGVINSLYLGNLDATSIQISIKDAPAGTVVYDSGIIYLDNSAPPDYYEYFFDPIKDLKNYLITNLAPYSTAEITVTISKNVTNAKCGILTVGTLNSLGRTVLGAVAKPKTYSYINTDSFGNTTIVRRKATTDMTASCVVDVESASATLAIVQSVLDVPCVWIANDTCELYNGLIVFGLGSGEMNYKDSTKCELSLSVQGLI